MATLIYWKYSNYTAGFGSGFSYSFNSRQERLHSATEIGEDLFMITFNPEDREVHLLGHLVIKRKMLNPPDYKYGCYRVEGDRDRSTYFDPEAQPLTPLLNEMSGIKSCDEASKYGQAFQTMRKLNDHDASLIEAFARNLPLHPRSRCKSIINACNRRWVSRRFLLRRCSAVEQELIWE